MDCGVRKKNMEAKLVFDLGDYAEAVRLYDENLVVDPGNEVASIYRGIAMAYESTMDNFMIDEALEACANGIYSFGQKMDREATYDLMYHTSKDLIHMTDTLLDRVLLFYENTTDVDVTYHDCIYKMEEIKMVQEFVVNLISDEMIRSKLSLREVKIQALQSMMNTNMQMSKKKMSGIGHGLV